MTAFINPAGESLLDAAALAEFLEGMSDDGLRGAREMFLMAADGWQVRIGTGDFMEFANSARAIPRAIATIIADHLETGIPVLAELERLSDLIDTAIASGDEIDQLEELFALPTDLDNRKGHHDDETID